MELGRENDRQNLFREIRESRRALAPFRDNRLSQIREYAGSRYGDGGPRLETIINYMAMTAEAYTMALAANCPQFLITSYAPSLIPFAKRFSTNLNNLVREIRLQQVIQECVLDAFFGLGVCKVYTANSVEVEVETDVWLDPGKPGASSISLDDFIFDMKAKSYSKVRYAADCYRIPFEKLKDSLFDQKIARKLQPTSRQDRSTRWDEQETAREMSEGDKKEDDLEDGIDLMDIWLPREGRIITIDCDMKYGPLVNRVDDTVEGGPYKLLRFMPVPDNIMPATPAGHLMSLHLLANQLYRKQKRQAQRQRDIPVFESDSADDAQRLQKADDGTWTRVARRDGVGVLKFGGVDQGNAGFAQIVEQLTSRAAGNLDAMAGLGPQADTLGQDRLIQGAISKREARMQQKTAEFVTEIGRDLGWLMWNDPLLEMSATMPGPGGVQVGLHWTPEHREADFLDYNFSIDPYQMAYQSPMERKAKIDQFFVQVQPFLPMWEQQGAFIDAQAMVGMYADLLNLPQLRELVRFTEPPTQPGRGIVGSNSRTRPTQTTRINERRDTGGRNRQVDASKLIGAMRGHQMEGAAV